MDLTNLLIWRGSLASLLHSASPTYEKIIGRDHVVSEGTLQQRDRELVTELAKDVLALDSKIAFMERNECYE